MKSAGRDSQICHIIESVSATDLVGVCRLRSISMRPVKLSPSAISDDQTCAQIVCLVIRR